MIYTYEILRVDEPARVMEVAYTHETHGVLHVGVRLPFVGESVEAVIAQFAPIAYWRELETPMVSPTVGASGVVDTSNLSQANPNEVQI
jgi:hypothetical protein